jgi:4-hydroxy-tetrahydrodipicolinate reductase
MRRLLVVGHGRMGRLVEQLAPSYGFEVAGILDHATNPGGTGATAERCRAVDVAVDFSTAEATLATVPRLAAHGVHLVVGSTGWGAREAELREAIVGAGVGAVVAANFSRAANLFDALVAAAGGLFASADNYGAFIHEAHHKAKKDAPSGTALMLRRALERGGYALPVDVSSTRAGWIPGTHTVGFDGPAETLTMTHLVRDRATFAHGALEAARWVIGRRGIFTMQDVLGIG